MPIVVSRNKRPRCSAKASSRRSRRDCSKSSLDPERLGEQIYHGYELAAVQWAFGLLDAAGFRARALYGMVLVLLAVASDAVRPELEAEAQELERELAAVAVRSSPRGKRFA